MKCIRSASITTVRFIIIIIIIIIIAVVVVLLLLTVRYYYISFAFCPFLFAIKICYLVFDSRTIYVHLIMSFFHVMQNRTLSAKIWINLIIHTVRSGLEKTTKEIVECEQKSSVIRIFAVRIPTLRPFTVRPALMPRALDSLLAFFINL